MELSLIDIDTLSEILKARNLLIIQRTADYLAQHTAFALSAATRYEVLRGLKQKGAPRQLAQFHTFCQKSEIIPVTDTIFDRASDLWAIAYNGGFLVKIRTSSLPPRRSN